MFNALKQFIFLENAQDRHKSIQNYAENCNTWQLNLLTWQILSLLPTDKETATLAQSLKISAVPGSEWAIFSYLLQEEHDSTVTRECILNLAQSPNHPLGDKIRNLVHSKINNPDILYATLEYIEKTGDERFKDLVKIEDVFSHSDSYSEKLFNAFLKLSVISEKAKELCFEILTKYTERNTKVFHHYSAIYYLFFSANHDDFKKLQQIKNTIQNPQLSKIFELCFTLFSPFADNSKSQFFEIALCQNNPLFFGYGMLTQEELIPLTVSFISQYAKTHPIEVTRTILSLRNSSCTQILSEDKILGISALEQNFHHLSLKKSPCKLEDKNNCIQLWTSFFPYENENFVQSVKNPTNYNLWHKNSPNLGFCLLDYNTLFHSQNPQSFVWQDFFEENLEKNISISMNILFFQIYAFRNSNPSTEAENKIIENVKLCLKNTDDHDLFIDKIYALCISTNASPHFIKEIYNLIPFSCTSWAFIAIALTAPKLDIQTLNYAILRELQSIRRALLNENLDKEEYILEVTTRFQSIIIGADKFRVQVTQPTLNALKEIANLIQNILDTIDESSDKKENANPDEGADWKGDFILDKPIMRWNAILQVCLNSFLSSDELHEYEKILCEGLRVAPHVEKRWVVRSLIHIDSDDAIKTILYQALHHIDSDFAERTLYELFSSNHPRAKQALIRSISKNNITDKTKIAIVERMKYFASPEILQEFKDLLHIRLPEKIERAVHDALVEISKNMESIEEESAKDHKFTSAEIDFVIKTFIHDVPLLSVDSRSALRTAEMIFIQSKDWGKEAVDLSPIVNMYCKSVELVLRDTFEPFTDAIIRKGELTKKLDSLGYTKMTQDKMQSFEDFIADLPVINSIPYFSKFKLRKMLRAICLYRPGKRFTLDGPKAFALFLLVTARKSCPYSLEKIFNLFFFSDLELFEFVKQIHSLQDSRNRAVHEGLTWEARDEIDNMRKQSYSIIDTCLKIGVKLKAQNKEIEARV